MTQQNPVPGQAGSVPAPLDIASLKAVLAQAAESLRGVADGYRQLATIADPVAQAAARDVLTTRSITALAQNAHATTAALVLTITNQARISDALVASLGLIQKLADGVTRLDARTQPPQ